MTNPTEPGPGAAPEPVGAAGALLDAVVAITSDLELHRVLERIVVNSCALTGARYGFLGVMEEDGTFGDFVSHGLDDREMGHIASLPQGLGLLGLITEDPRPLRLRRIADHERAHGFPQGHPEMESFLGVPVRIRGEVFGNLYLTEKAGGGDFTDQDEALVTALAHAAGYVIDNARVFERSERRQAWLEAAARVGEVLQPRPGVDDVLPEVVAVAREAAGAQVAALLQSADHGYDVTAVAGTDDDLMAVVTDVLGPATRVEADGEAALVGVAGARRATLVPVPSRLASGGVLLLLPRPGARGLGPDELDHVRGFAEQVALVLDRALALDERHELMLVADRERIARDLHDLVIQRLFATGLQLQGVRQMAVTEELSSRLDDAVRDLDVTIRDIRSTIFELQHRRETSFRAEVRALVKEYVPVLGFSPLVRTSGPLDSVVTDEAGDHLLATLREALSNVVRHAGAEACVVEVDFTDGWLHLSVTDNGAGLPEELHESGLRNARRRAADIGGRMRLLPEEPHGTRLEWGVPLQG
jgi:signal transduction histidine kinase